MKGLCPIHGVFDKQHKKDRCPKCAAKAAARYDREDRDPESRKIYDSARWRYGVRPAILYRDGYKCQMCGRVAKSRELHVDHIIELRDGGDPYDHDNLQTLCHSCHQVKTAAEKIKRGGRAKFLADQSPTTAPPPKLSRTSFRGGTP